MMLSRRSHSTSAGCFLYFTTSITFAMPVCLQRARFGRCDEAMERASNQIVMRRISVCLCGVFGLLIGAGQAIAQQPEDPAVPDRNVPVQNLSVRKVSLDTGLVKSDTQHQGQANRVVDALDALKRLKDGNERFVSGKPRHPHETTAWRHLLESGQHPFAVVLGCSDSRVPPELIFDQGFGDLFVVRVAGNVVDTDVTASVEYAIDHLDTQLIVVMGHSHCGAVTATLDHLTNIDDEPAEVVSLLYRIEPAILGIDPALPRDQRIDCAVKKNVELAVRRLSRVPDLRRSIDAGKIKIVGAVYDMHSGKIDFQDEPAPSRRTPLTTR